MFCGNSLVVQWLGLCSHCLGPGTWVQFLIKELRSHKLYGQEKKVLLNVRILVDRAFFFFFFFAAFQVCFSFSLANFSFSHAIWLTGSWFPNQGLNLSPRQWECGVLLDYHWTAREVLLLLISRVSPLAFSRLTMICEGVDPFALSFLEFVKLLGRADWYFRHIWSLQPSCLWLFPSPSPLLSSCVHATYLCTDCCPVCLWGLVQFSEFCFLVLIAWSLSICPQVCWFLLPGQLCCCAPRLCLLTSVSGLCNSRIFIWFFLVISSSLLIFSI